MERTFISELIPNKQSKICGSIERIRDSKNMIFIVLRVVLKWRWLWRKMLFPFKKNGHRLYKVFGVA